MSHRELASTLLERLAKALGRELKVNSRVLFGSYARGRPGQAAT